MINDSSRTGNATTAIFNYDLRYAPPPHYPAPVDLPMFPKPLRCLMCVLCWYVAGSTATALARDEAPSDQELETARSHRIEPVAREIEGWTVHVDPALLEGDEAAAGERALAMLANHLQRISIVVPPAALEKLQRIEIWIEREHPVLGPMQYHPSEDWLIEHGHDHRLARKVHVTRARDLLSREQMLKHPAVILHELAHGYHDQFLGFDQPEIVAAYEAAKMGGDYEQVLLYTGNTVRHYGLTTPMEYFAEGTEAYFYRNDFYPFVRAELEQHDPTLAALLKRFWEDQN